MVYRDVQSRNILKFEAGLWRRNFRVTKIVAWSSPPDCVFRNFKWSSWWRFSILSKSHVIVHSCASFTLRTRYMRPFFQRHEWRPLICTPTIKRSTATGNLINVCTPKNNVSLEILGQLERRDVGNVCYTMQEHLHNNIELWGGVVWM